MSNDLFDFSKSTGLSVDGISRSFQTSLKVGRSIGGWSLKRRLEKEGYDPITVDAAVEAVKAGRDPEAILFQARQAYALKEKQHAMRKNPPPVHGSAAWATLLDLQKAELLHANTGAGLSLGNCSSQPITWQGESHLLTVAPT